MRRRDRDSLIEGVAMAVALVVFIVAGVYMRAVVPCDWIDWLPAAEVPARCLR